MINSSVIWNINIYNMFLNKFVRFIKLCNFFFVLHKEGLIEVFAVLMQRLPAVDHLPQGSRPTLISQKLHHLHIGKPIRYTDPLLQAAGLLESTTHEQT